MSKIKFGGQIGRPANSLTRPGVVLMNKQRQIRNSFVCKTVLYLFLKSHIFSWPSSLIGDRCCGYKYGVRNRFAKLPYSYPTFSLFVPTPVTLRTHVTIFPLQVTLPST